MDHTPKNSVTCIRCHECCKWMTFIITPEDPQAMAKHIIFYKTRGCKVVTNPVGRYGPGATLSIMVPYMCPELKMTAVGGMCRIYDQRPEACREYDGRWDPHMAPYCKLPVEVMDMGTVRMRDISFSEGSEEVTELSVGQGPNPFYECPFCGVLDPGELVCSSCGKNMQPPEDDNG